MNILPNSNENLNIPKWINVEYFKKILNIDGENYLKISKFTAVAAIPPGENFTSVMLRIHLELELEDGSKKYKTYVMKTMLDDEKGGHEIKRMESFPKELDMYGKFLPAFEKLYRDAGRMVRLAPHCLLAESTGNRINFVFEDLVARGFLNADRIKGLNMDEMSRTLQKLAEFHAASVVYFEQNGPYPEKYNFSFVQKSDYEFQKKLFEMRDDLFKEAMKGWGLKDIDQYLKKFPTFDQYWKCMMSMLNTSQNSFNVLNHADLWSSNAMYAYLENGTVDGVLLLDYQMCKWGSPAEDLIFLITISAAKDIRIKKYENFVAIYHEHLIECLKVLSYKKPLPKLRELQMDMYRENNSFHAMQAILNHLPLVLLPSDKDSNIASLMNPNEDGQRFRMKLYTSSYFKEAMLDIIPFYHNRGVLNFSDYDE